MSTWDPGKPFYRQQQLPVFQNRTYRTPGEARACPKGDVILAQDLRTGIVHNVAFQPELMAYDSEYQNEQALSGRFRSHLEDVAALVDRYLGRTGIVEVGCGKGYFLELLESRGFDVHGFDPTYEGNNPRVERCYFEAGVGIRARGLVLRHVLEHVADPGGFLLALREANAGGGRIYIEVPCFDWICLHRAWFDIFYEHVNYFRLADLHRLFDGVVESGHIFGGQYLYLVADLERLRDAPTGAVLPVDFPADFAAGITRHRLPPGIASLVWGGASKGVIFALLRERAGMPVSGVVDINPAKQGGYLPATGLLVERPAQGLARLPLGGTIYVMNSNYLAEIKDMSDNAFNYVEVDRD